MVDQLTLNRANRTRQFSDGLDNEKAYRDNIRSPIASNHVSFSSTDFSYTYNSHGYRCPEFDKTDIDVLYAGCSFTEGEGLPLEYVWTSQLNSMIETEYGVNPGLVSVARGGLSPSGITRRIYGAFEDLKLRPKLVLVLFPSIFRDEFTIKNFDKYYAFDYVPSYIPPTLDRDQKKFLMHYEETVRVSNVVNDFFKNIVLIDSICRTYGAEFRFSCWQGMVPINELVNRNVDDLPAKYLTWDKTGILLDELLADYMPPSVSHKYLGERFVHRDYEVETVYEQTIARDYAHPGPNPQLRFAKQMFTFIKPELDRIYENNQHPEPDAVESVLHSTVDTPS